MLLYAAGSWGAAVAVSNVFAAAIALVVSVCHAADKLADAAGVSDAVLPERWAESAKTTRSCET
eukprot:11158642-Alexandrium_andersonii.AAC.1